MIQKLGFGNFSERYYAALRTWRFQEKGNSLAGAFDFKNCPQVPKMVPRLLSPFMDVCQTLG